MAGGVELAGVGVELIPDPTSSTNIVVGTTTITGGSSGNILYDNGGVLGEKTTTGSGAVVLANTPTLITPVLGAATGTSLALGGATLGGNALAVTGTSAFSGQISSSLTTGTAPFSITSTTLVPNLYVARAVVADSATTSANLTGPITSVGNATSIASQTGTGTKFVVDTSPTLVTPNIGVAAGTSLGLGGATIGTNTLAVGTTGGSTRSTFLGTIGEVGGTAGNGYIGIGSAPVSGYGIFLQVPTVNLTNGNEVIGAQFGVQNTPTIAVTGATAVFGVTSLGAWTGSANSTTNGIVQGGQFTAQMSGTPSLGNAYGVENVISDLRTGGTVVNGYANWSHIVTGNAGGLFTNAYANRADVGVNGGGANGVTNAVGYFVGSVVGTNAYGIKITDVTNGSSLNYAIYTGLGASHFGGAIDAPSATIPTLYGLVNIGDSTTSSSKLAVLGKTGQSENLFETKINGVINFSIANGGGVSFFADTNYSGNTAIFGSGQSIRIADGQIAQRATGTIGWSSTTHAYDTLDTFLTRGASAATIQQGASDAAVAIAQTTRVQSVVAGTTAANGANWTLIGSLPTGAGTSGDIIVQTGVKTGSGTTQGTPTTALTIKGETQTVLVASGKQLQLGNSAVTGLVAGALAALTNATITLTDSTGQVYRIPCVI